MRISSDKWTGKEVDKSGKFVRQKNRFDTPFGEEEGQLPVEAVDTDFSGHRYARGRTEVLS